ncbi:hypothetical protein J22TS3_39420 [Paenibacillus sp. J22TS3]|nr:glycosyl hydrolase family 18 protein [Paenibacillus sp. J22TS3]GIP23667.1 hypothetical protein J22TS3_39420 [Paenibacillus sp. J22TS3]
MKPDNSLTRAELIALINRYFNFTEEKAISFTDIKGDKWYHSEIAKAVQAGYVNGYSDGTIRPDQKVSRQETAVMLARALKLDAAASTGNLNSFKDAAAIASWSKDAVSSLAGRGVIEGYEDGTYRPNANLTRAEGVVLLSRMLNAQTVTYDKAGTYGPAAGTVTVLGNVTINAAGTTLQNTVIRGNLLLGKGIENGDVTLKNVKVDGTATVNGGGENSIHLVNTVLTKLIVNKLGGVVRIVAEGTSSIQETYVVSSAKLEEAGTGAGFIKVIFAKELPTGSVVTLTGAFSTLAMEASNIKVEFLKGLVESMTVNGSGNTIHLGKDAIIAKLILNAAVKVLGFGQVQHATVNEGGKGSSFETAPGKADGPQSGSISSGTSGSNNGGTGGSTGNNGGSAGGGSNNGGGTDPSGPAAPVVLNVVEGKTYTSGVLPNWTDAAGTTSTATLNGKTYVKGTGITDAGEYALVVTASKNGKSASTTVKFKIDPALRIIGYVPGWVDWSDANTVDVAKMTHLNYAFNHIDKDHKLIPFQGNYHDDQNYAYLSSLKSKNPNLKILNSVGGWGADGFSDAAATPAARETFVNSVIEHIKKYNLDGVDLDWEYPTQTAGDLIKATPEDKENFTLLLQTVRERLNKLGLENNKYYELTICAAAASDYPKWVELDKIIPLLDSLNIMTYDLAGGWVQKTAHHTNLYAGRSVDSTVQMFFDHNVPASKIAIGAAFYAHKWTEVEADGENILDQKAKGSEETPTYNDILTKYNEEHGFIRHWDDAAKAPYLYNPTTKEFLSYDDPQSVTEKGKYVLDKKLGGVLFWEYSQDKTGALLEALNNGLQGKPYEVDNTVPDAPKVVNVTEGTTYTSGVLPNWTDAKGTYSSATLNGKAYVKGTGINEAGDYTLVVTAIHGKSLKTSSTTVKFKVEPALRIIGYVPGWVDWSDANTVDVAKMTHLNYAFNHIDKDHKLVPFQGNYHDDQNYAYLSSLKSKNPNLKILNSVGGWGADGFSDAAATPAARETFVNSVIEHIKKYNLDGVDLDWEYPTQTAGDLIKATPEDKENFTLLLQTVRERLNKLGLENNKYYELTICAAAASDYPKWVELDKIIPLLDSLNIMTYDLAGGWVQKTAHHTNLYAGRSVDSTVQMFFDHNVPASKIAIGAAFYAHKWTEVEADGENILDQKAKGSEETPTYNDILTKYNEEHGFIRHWDEAAKAPYLYNPTTKEFLSYDDPQSLTEKGKYVLDKKLGGVLFWEYSQDKTGALLGALYDALQGKAPEPDTNAN